MMVVIAIDPGDRHVGWAEWRGEATGRSHYQAREVDAEDAVGQVDQELGMLQTSRYPTKLVLEEFRLYPGLAREQSWSPMETAQMIGALKWVAKQRDTEVIEQGASIQKSTEAQLQARGIELVRAGPHAKSAQLHLIHYLIKEGMWRT